ncbi:MAG TPA: VOC family protein [Acidimicrobiia bacterium]|nr:VOC family protein [Acidimicrobiia bacterium]
MAFHHVAITTRDLEATHAFYTEAMGFELVRAETARTPESAESGDGWARHLFYDTGGGQCLAVWDLHDPEHLPTEFDPSISRALGLPPWTNHIAFDAPDLDALEAHKQRWIDRSLPVVEIDHGWCTSIYAEDPNGITVEFCCTTRRFDDADHADALEKLTAERPPLSASPEARFFIPEGTPAGG